MTKARTAALLALMTLMIVVPGAASADHTSGSRAVVGGFGIDGDFLFPSNPALAGETRDWNTADVTVIEDEFDGDGDAEPDDMFGMGSKEQDPDGWSFVEGKPPGKDDITRVFAASEVLEGSTYLWLGFERLAVSGQGDAHVNFEINQSTATVTNSKGTTIPERTTDDLLFVYDYSGGTGPVTIEVRRWIGTALAGSWSAPITVAPGLAHGDVNDEVAPRPGSGPLGGGSAEPRRFGEAGIDVFQIFGPDFLGCPGFSTIYAKSRSSGESFNSALQDVTARAPFEFSTCGTVTVFKETDGGQPLDGAVFELWEDDGDGTFDELLDSVVGTCTSGEEGTTGRCTFEDVEPGEYFVRETEAPEGFVVDGTVAPVTVGFREDVVVSHTFVDPKIRYRLTIAPENDRNLVDNDHIFTAHLETSLDSGQTWVDAAGETVEFSLSGPGEITAISPAGPTATSCTTDDAGSCTVTVRSAETGETTLTGAFEKQTATTPATAGASATKDWVDYRISVTPTGAVNLVNQAGSTFEHTFTVLLERSEEDGVWEPASGETAAVSLSGVGEITSIVPDGPDAGTCTTAADGTCAVTITSDDPGQSVLTASYEAVESDTSFTFEASATKDWVDYRIAVTPETAENVVNQDGTDFTHTFTVTLERTTDGSAYAPVEGATVAVALDGVGEITAIDPAGPSASTCTTDAAGQCAVTIRSDDAGTSTLTASFDAVEGDTSFTFEAQATKDWIDFRIDIGPDGETNLIGDDHVFTVTLERTGDGVTFDPVAGATVSFTLEGVGAFVGFEPEGPAEDSCTTDDDGRCTATISSTDAGQTIVTASYDAVLGETSFTFSDDALKRWVVVDLVKNACPSETSPRGGRVDYTLSFSIGGAGLTDVHVTDDLPPGVTFVSASDIAGVTPTTPEVGSENGIVEWVFPTITEGTYEGSISVTVGTNPDVVPDGTTITNAVTFDPAEGVPQTATHTFMVDDLPGGEARAIGLRADLFGDGLLFGDPDIAATPDSDDDNPGEAFSVPSPFGADQPLVRVLTVAETDTSTLETTELSSIATAADVDLDIPGAVRVQASNVVARSFSSAGITSAASSSLGSRVTDLVIDGERYGDITEPTTIAVTDPLTGMVRAEVHVLEHVATGAAAEEPQPTPNSSFETSLTVNGIHVVVHDIKATPVVEASDILVGSAMSSATHASGIGCSALPAVGGGAVALGVHGTEQLEGELDHRLAQVVLPTLGGDEQASLVSIVTPIVTADAASASTAGTTSVDPEAAEAHSVARIEGLDLAEAIQATLVEATADVTLEEVSGSTTLAGLVIGGTDVCDSLGLASTCTPMANTMLRLPTIGTVVMLNEQITEPGGIRVNAVHLWIVGQNNKLGLPVGAEIIISSARANAFASTF